MAITKTFDEIFEQLYHLYKEKWIQIEVKKANLVISNFRVYVKDLQIHPLDDKKFLKQMGLKKREKLGSMVIIGSSSHKGKVFNCLNIPFKLGFNTMDAHFVKNNVSIESCGFKFTFHKLAIKN